MRKWDKANRYYDVELVNEDGDIVKARISLDNVSRLIAIPDISDVVTPLATNTLTKLSNRTHLQIHGQTYIGTVKSTITDSVVDIYYISREYSTIEKKVVNDKVVETEATGVEDFFLIVSSTLFLGEYGMMPKDGNIELFGVVAGVDDLILSTDGFDTSITMLDSDLTVSSYLSDETVDFSNAVGYLSTYTLPGLTTDNLITSVRAKEVDGTLVSKYGASQLLILEDAKSLFTDRDELLLGSIKQTSFNRFKISNSVFHKVDEYNIAIPLNF